MFGGLALFLYGMSILGSGLVSVFYSDALSDFPPACPQNGENYMPLVRLDTRRFYVLLNVPLPAKASPRGEAF